jgi:hypothetical protein
MCYSCMVGEEINFCPLIILILKVVSVIDDDLHTNVDSRKTVFSAMLFTGKMSRPFIHQALNGSVR